MGQALNWHWKQGHDTSIIPGDVLQAAHTTAVILSRYHQPKARQTGNAERP